MKDNRTGHLPQAGLMLVILSLLAPPVSAQQLPRWIELQSIDEIQFIAADGDNDGILDNREQMIGTDPNRADTDGDGFADLFEDSYRAFGFDPLTRNADSDNDGLTDKFERERGTSSESPDSDHDGLSDFDEVMNERFGYDPLKPTRDSDFDGLTDRLEKQIGSSPRTPDTNSDGVNDFEAYYEGLSPQEELDGGFGEIVGRAYSSRMQKAIEKMRSGDPFPRELALELAYPVVTRRLYGVPSRAVSAEAEIIRVAPQTALTPSAALLQSGVASNPDLFYVTALYPTYNEIVTQLKDIALAFDGSAKPDIVRIFYWSEPTEGHRWIYALKISDNPHVNEKEPEMLFMGLHHGRELITASYTLELVRRLTNAYAAGDLGVQARVNNSEIWVIPVVNPDGYAMAQSEFNQGANVNWRKNIRKVTELGTAGESQTEASKGVDPNRNYDYSHIRTLSQAQRLALDHITCAANGLTDIGHPTLFPCEGFATYSDTYAGASGFSDVEARSVRMLADDQFERANEIDGLRCSLSWHTGGRGAIIAPMDHDEPATVSPTDQTKLGKLGNAFAAATGYYYYADTWWTIPMNYQAFGTSDDWLYTHNGILPLTIEAYPSIQGPVFFPETFAAKKASIDRNLLGAKAFMNTCAPLRAIRTGL